MAEAIPTPQLLGRARVLRVRGERLWVSRGIDLYESTDGGVSFIRRAVGPAGRFGRGLARLPIIPRLLRAGIFDVLELANGDLVAVFPGGIAYCSAQSERFEFVHTDLQGTRPLNLCQAKSGIIYFGEYASNRARGEMRIFGSEDGQSWAVVHVFPPGAIRHVHGIVHDPWRGGEWVLTGDEGEEAGLWFTCDGFRTLQPVARGTQRARSVFVLPRRDGLIVPMDSPDQPNFIQHFEPESGRFRDLAPVPGPVFFATECGTLSFVSTVVEKSTVNTDQQVSLLASLDGVEWHTVARCPRDLAWLRDRRGYLMYPTLVLSRGEGDGMYLHASGQSLRGLHDRHLRWDLKGLEVALRARRGICDD